MSGVMEGRGRSVGQQQRTVARRAAGRCAGARGARRRWSCGCCAASAWTRWRARPARRPARSAAGVRRSCGRPGGPEEPAGAGRGAPARRRAAQDRRAGDGQRHPARPGRGDGPPPSVAEALNVAERLEAPLARVCRVAGRLQVGGVRAAPPTQRLGAHRSIARAGGPGRSARMPDRELLAAIRREIAESPFVGEGHKKLTARLRLRGICTSRKRVLRLMREARAARADAAGPQAQPAPARRAHHHRHVPDELWATDPTEAWTRQDGRCAVFAIVDHCTGEAWVDAAPRMDRWAAADLLREAIARPLRLRRGRRRRRPEAAPRRRQLLPLRRTTRPRSTTSASSARRPSIYEPETNGVVEKFIQTLKEQVLWIERFDTLEQLRARVRQFAARLQRALAARTPRLPHTHAKPATPSPSDAAMA